MSRSPRAVAHVSADQDLVSQVLYLSLKIKKESMLLAVNAVALAAVDDDALALAWSVAHGVACLISDGVWQRGDPRARAALRQAAELINPSKG